MNCPHCGKNTDLVGRAHMDKIKRVVTDMLARDFEHVRIVNVRVYEDEDADSGEILRIDVIFEGTPKDIDARKLSGMVRRVRPRLLELGEAAFPLFSFISRTDTGARKLAPA